MDQETQWQPARMKMVHGAYDVPVEELEELRRLTLRIRPTKRQFYPKDRLKLGCDAIQFYEVHPEDIPPGCGDLLCEHEILTD
jgi:hypothetical protein